MASPGDPVSPKYDDVSGSKNGVASPVTDVLLSPDDNLPQIYVKVEHDSGSEEDPDPDSASVHSEVFEPPDGGWGWLVCFASFWTNGTLFGLLNVFGILYVEMLDVFGGNGDEDLYYKLSWIGALQIATTFFMSMFSSILVDLFGIQLMSGIGAALCCAGMLVSSFVSTVEVLYLTYGIMIGLGSSLLYTPSMSILGDYFRKHLGLVNGIVAFGSSVFTFILSFAVPALLENLGLRNTMRCLSGTFVVLFACPFIWRPLSYRKVPEKDDEGVDDDEDMDTTREDQDVIQTRSGCGQTCARKCRNIINTDMFKNKGYVVWLVGCPIAFFGYFIPFVHIVKHTKEVFPGYNPDILVTCIGGISGVSRLASGKLADVPGMNRVWIQQVSFVVLGVSTSLIPFAGHYGVLVMLACLMGICDGCFICMLGPIAFDLLGAEGMGQGLGFLLGIMSIPMTAGPPIAGLLRGTLGSYKIAFLIGGFTPIIGSCILFLMPRRQKKQTEETDDITTTLPLKHTPTIQDQILSMSMEVLNRLDINDERRSLNRSKLSLAFPGVHSHLSNSKLSVRTDASRTSTPAVERKLTSSNTNVNGLRASARSAS